MKSPAYLPLCASLLVGFFSSPALAQQAPPAAESYLHGTYFLRSRCGDSDLHFDSTGQLQQRCRKLVSFTLAAIEIEDMKPQDGTLTIQAKRRGLYRNPSDDEPHLVDLKTNVTLTIDGPPAASLNDFAHALSSALAPSFSWLMWLRHSGSTTCKPSLMPKLSTRIPCQEWKFLA